MGKSSSSSSSTTPARSPAPPTPQRQGSTPRLNANNNNNYAAPHTPIASVKRPRSSLSNSAKKLMSPNGGGNNTKNRLPVTPLLKGTKSPNIADDEDNSNNNNPASEALSPMHPARPMKVHEPTKQALLKEKLAMPLQDDEEETEDALFSPVLHFVAEEEDEEEEPGASIGAKPQLSNSTATTEATTAVSEEQHHVTSTQDHQYRDSKEESTEEEEEEEEESQYEGEEEEEDEDEFNPYLFIKQLPRYEHVSNLRPPITLPPKAKDSPPISLVLDLDETLVHCTVEPVPDADLVFPVVFHGMTYQVHVRLRPHLFTFLEKIKDKYEVIVFTASQQVYANELLDLIDPDGKYVHHRLFRESCLAVEGNFLKDLNVLGRDLSKTVLVDNSPHAFGYQVDNGIPIESWFDEPSDTELLKLERFLRTLQAAPDVRRLVRKKFQTYKLVRDA